MLTSSSSLHPLQGTEQSIALLTHLWPVCMQRPHFSNCYIRLNLPCLVVLLFYYNRLTFLLQPSIGEHACRPSVHMYILGMLLSSAVAKSWSHAFLIQLILPLHRMRDDIKELLGPPSPWKWHFLCSLLRLRASQNAEMEGHPLPVSEQGERKRIYTV